MVSVATFGESKFRLGPLQRTGTTPARLHVATLVPSLVIATIVAVRRLTPLVMLANHFATWTVSGPSGRLNFTLEYFKRVGSCQMSPLLPPSSRCPSPTPTPSPSQLLNVPRSLPSMDTAKHTLTAGAAAGMGGSPNPQGGGSAGPPAG